MILSIAKVIVLVVLLIFLVLVAYLLGMLIFYIVKSLKREAKGGSKYERHRKP